MVVHEKNYSVFFPAATFDENGIHKKMSSSVFHLEQLLRWEMHGRPYAYTYEISPDHLLCITTVDIIDDKGDGKFRLMTSPGHIIMGQNSAPPPVPEWLHPPKS